MSDSVTLAYVHPTEVGHNFHNSLVHLLMLDAQHESRIIRGGYIPVRCGTGGLVQARNMVAEGFLARPSDWLFIVDTDMGFAPDTLERLLDVADADERPIVGALCVAQREVTEDGMSGYRCSPRVTISDWVDTPDGPKMMGRTRYPINAVVRCAGTGSACILIHRSVFEAIADKYGPTWYNRITGSDGSLLGEDISFCVRAAAVDKPIHVHTGVRTTHLKPVWLAEQDYWDAFIAPPASQPAAVIVPVLRRPDNAQPFMRSLRASTGMARVYAIADRDDPETAEAWLSAGAVVIVDDVVTFARKVNLGYSHSTEPWLFVVGDDVRFHPGWLDHAQHIGDELGASVVGTNDLGNPHVLAGEHATHLLIRRSYVDADGASWDGPGVVAHEGYRHWFVDNEIVTAAQQRNVWAMALGSIVEHLHPLFGKADHDDTYALGESASSDDRELFKQRCAEHLNAS